MTGLCLSALWPLWPGTPPVGTIVHILEMAQLTREATLPAFDPLPGGFFAEVQDAPQHRRTKWQGALRVLTIPASATEHARYGSWQWECLFPFNVRANAAADGMRLEQVPEDIQDAVRAFTVLNARDDMMPIVVQDGWLC